MTAHQNRLPHPGRKRVAHALTAGLATAIFVLALIPLPSPPQVPGTDKTHHFIAFAALVLPAALLYPRMLWWYCPAPG